MDSSYSFDMETRIPLLSREEALAFIHDVRKRHWYVYGWDVYLKDGTEFLRTYDNWFKDDLPNESDAEYSENSCRHAEEFILNYSPLAPIIAYGHLPVPPKGPQDLLEPFFDIVSWFSREP